MNRAFRIAILETGLPPSSLVGRYGSYPAMMERMLAPLDPGFTFVTVKTAAGEAAPAPVDYDGLLITGSAAGAYDGHPWIAPLEEAIRAAARAGKPQVGICFGHQIMAQAFGGRVEKSDRGWGVGLHGYTVESAAPWLVPAPSQFSCAVSHQDQVVALPAAGRRLAGSDFCPNGVVAYAHAPAISFQMHPEFETAFAVDLLKSREERVPRALLDDGLATLKKRSDRGLIARWIANFYRSAPGANI